MKPAAVGLAFEGVASRDLSMPIERLTASGWFTQFVGRTTGSVHGFDPLRRFDVDLTVTDTANPVAVVVPGGFDWRGLARDEVVLAWLRRSAASGAFVVGVSTGALVVAAAGLLGDRHATGHWLALDDLAALGAVVDPDPLVRSGKVFTASGALAALDAVDAIIEEVRWGRGSAPVA
jgi:transcriptional regulator GlxA family with amidase domain